MLAFFILRLITLQWAGLIWFQHSHSALDILASTIQSWWIWALALPAAALLLQESPSESWWSRLYSTHPSGSAPRAVWSCRGVGSNSFGQRNPQCQPVAIWSQNLLCWGCKGMQQEAWFYWKTTANIHEIQLLTEAKKLCLNSGMKCTIHVVANFSLKQWEYHVSVTP